MPRPAIHPGEILRDELNELGVTPTKLARQINVPPNRVTEIIHGRRSITGDTALRLGHWFGTSARFWLNLQTAYEIRTAEELVGAEIKRLPLRDQISAMLKLNVEPGAENREVASKKAFAAAPERPAKKATAKRPAPARNRA
jgi:addiction module HigA family antidote